MNAMKPERSLPTITIFCTINRSLVAVIADLKKYSYKCVVLLFDVSSY